MFGYDTVEDYLNDDAARKREEAEVMEIILEAEKEFKPSKNYRSIELALKTKQERFDLIGPEDY